MIVELLCRYPKKMDTKTQKEIELELDTQELINGNFDKELERTLMYDKHLGYEYGKFSFDLKDVMQFNFVDEEHTCVRFYNSTAFTYKVTYDSFRAIYQSMLGKIVNDFTDIKNLPTDEQ